jgi:hypothetical protein
MGKSLEEQKLEDCIASADVLISLERQKLELLEKHKKGLIQKLSLITVQDCEKLGLKHNWCNQFEMPRYCSICNKEED